MTDAFEPATEDRRTNGLDAGAVVEERWVSIALAAAVGALLWFARRRWWRR